MLNVLKNRAASIGPSNLLSYVISKQESPIVFMSKTCWYSTLTSHPDFSSLTEENQSDSNSFQPILRPPLPIVTSRKLAYPPKFRKIRQSWVENLDTVESQKLGLVDLHPDIFAEFPRVDILHLNVVWQQQYRRVDWATARVRAEVRGGGRKPWPQKGTGRARHGSIRSPLWKGGGVVHGPRGPRTYFYMLPLFVRVKGLIAALSAKFAQDDLKIVDTLVLPTDESKFLEELVEQRQWGPSVLFVDDTDIMPRNISLASDKIKHMNLMPVYGLNVYSMLKHETLVLTLEALERIEERLLFHLHRQDVYDVLVRFRY